MLTKWSKRYKQDELINENAEMKITKLTDYGVQLLAHIASNTSTEIFSAKTLSEECNLPLPTVGKILKTLTHRGFLTSQQGSQGGYSLINSTNQITLLNIVQALEGPIAITDCCSQMGCTRNCHLSPHWKKLNRTIKDSLSNLSLTDMIN